MKTESKTYPNNKSDIKVVSGTRPMDDDRVSEFIIDWAKRKDFGSSPNWMVAKRVYRSHYV